MPGTLPSITDLLNLFGMTTGTSTLWASLSRSVPIRFLRNDEYCQSMNQPMLDHQKNLRMVRSAQPSNLFLSHNFHSTTPPHSITAFILSGECWTSVFSNSRGE